MPVFELTISVSYAMVTTLRRKEDGARIPSTIRTLGENWEGLEDDAIGRCVSHSAETPSFWCQQQRMHMDRMVWAANLVGRQRISLGFHYHINLVVSRSKKGSVFVQISTMLPED